MSKVKTTRYMRKPFYVEAIKVTENNIFDIAEWCGGQIVEEHKGSHIKVNVLNPMHDWQTRAHVGDWVLKGQDNAYKIYTDKAFKKCFDLTIDDMPKPRQTPKMNIQMHDGSSQRPPSNPTIPPATAGHILRGMAAGLKAAADAAETRQGESK